MGVFKVVAPGVVIAIGQVCSQLEISVDFSAPHGKDDLGSGDLHGTVGFVAFDCHSAFELASAGENFDACLLRQIPIVMGQV